MEPCNCDPLAGEHEVGCPVFEPDFTYRERRALREVLRKHGHTE